MEKLLTSLTNASIKELEKNDFQLDQTKKKGKARAVPSSLNRRRHRRRPMSTEEDEEIPHDDDDSHSDASSNDDDNDDDDDDDDNVSIESQTSSNNNIPNIPLEERLSNLDIKDYDAITYTGRSASMDLIHTGTDLYRLFNQKPYIVWPGRDDVVIQLTAQNELMIIRSIVENPTSSSTSSNTNTTTRLDIGLSMRSGGADINATTKDENEMTLNLTPPSKKEQEKIIAFFFEHLHPFMPVINKLRFLSTEQPPTILVQAILALTFRFISQHEPTQHLPQANEYAVYYFNKVVKRLRDPVRSRLCHVQSAVLMTLYLDMDDGDDSMQWYMLGTAIRMAQDLGLHRSCSHWKILPQAEIETRHRLFYACYVLDRWLSARAGKPLTILDRDFDTPMPSNQEYQAFAIMIKLSEILGRVLKALYAPKAKHANANAGLDDPTVIDAFDRRLKSCKAAMETEVPLTQKAYLDIFYHTILLLLHRPFMSQQQLSHQICTHAATTIMDLTRHIRQQPNKSADLYFSLCMPTCFVYALFQSTLVQLTNAVRDPTLYDMFQQSVSLMQQYQHLVVVQRALEIIELFRTMHAPAPATVANVDAAAVAAVAAARVAAANIHHQHHHAATIPFPPPPPTAGPTTMMLNDIYSVSQPPTPLVGATTGATPLYDWQPLLNTHHPQQHHHHQPHTQQATASHPTPPPQQGMSTTTTGMTTVFPTTFQEDLMNNNLTLTASPTSMHATISSSTTSNPSTTTASLPHHHHHHHHHHHGQHPPPNNPPPYHANSTSSTSSSSSSFISTPQHPMAAAMLPPSNTTHWTDWDVYLNDRSCQQPTPTVPSTPVRHSRHHHSASFPQASFSHLPHPPH
ncbi:fungal-specific transcription factor domain-containing protein [Phascolomyces articulosus]|uniref:Fungal-specific transcription factor domain-containing protein n=1 Tax=Phascolomyces articulosus TaxID=60185 RepID=A0AAD5PIN7_9FUNG|nr:fungal-specific transcription factor domain-containing protein [Phascolomyces articulosus]